MSRIHRIYDHDFRQEAVNLLLSSGRPLKQVAKELGVTANSLRAWRDSAPCRCGGGDPPPATRGRIPAPPARDLKKSHEHTLRRPAERYALIHSMRADFPITELCAALDVSRSGYHAARTRTPGTRHQYNQQLLQKMTAIHRHRHTRSYGSPRMTPELRDLGLPASENRVARLMRLAGIRARPRKPFRPKTTQPDHAAHPSPNLLAKAGPPLAPGTQLVSDITYIPTCEGWLYLAVVIDLFSRAILGWKLSDSLHTGIVTGALQRALDTGLVAPGALFHSDRGCQYSASLTRELLARRGLRQSMSAKGYCYDNAFAESAFASLKSDLLDDGLPLPSKPAASTAVFDYLETFYNRRRRHSSLGQLAPLTFLNHHFQTLNLSLN